jgi:hypothetical protein
MNNDKTEASPAKTVMAELEKLRAELHHATAIYTARLDSEIERVRLAVEAGRSSKSLSSARIRDLRDMLTLLGQDWAKAGKGRRKNLKKIESVISDLAMLIEHW